MDSKDFRGSVANAKSNGLGGQPCQIPLDSWKYNDCLVLVITEALDAVYKSLIHEMKLGP